MSVLWNTNPCPFFTVEVDTSIKEIHIFICFFSQSHQPGKYVRRLNINYNHPWLFIVLDESVDIVGTIVTFLCDALRRLEWSGRLFITVQPM